MISKNTKLVSGVVAVLFFSFAAVQYNDPDSWKWIIAYLVPAILFSLLVVGRYFNKAGRIFLIIFVFTGLLYIPDLWTWISSGMPSITESMQADKPLVELMREFFGLVIIMLALLYYTKMKY